MFIKILIVEKNPGKLSSKAASFKQEKSQSTPPPNKVIDNMICTCMSSLAQLVECQTLNSGVEGSKQAQNHFFYRITSFPARLRRVFLNVHILVYDQKSYFDVLSKITTKKGRYGIRTHPHGTRFLDCSGSDFFQGPQLASETTYLYDCTLTNGVAFTKMATKT